jgi:hypothetical protein
MQGLEGIILRRKDRCRVVFSLELIMRSVAVEVDESEVEPVTATKRSSSSSCARQNQSNWPDSINLVPKTTIGLSYRRPAVVKRVQVL